MKPHTTKYQFIESQIDGTLKASVEAMREGGKSWRQIARTLSEQSGIDVSDESIRIWFTPEAVAS